jgi:DNA polymerase type B, organellar and viral
VARKSKASERGVAVLDIETDPFLYGRVPKPFAVGVMIRDHDFDSLPVYRDFWGVDCVALAMDYIASHEKPLVVFAHNGGKFDFHYFLDRLQNPIRVIGGRIVKACFGHHEFRDSWAIVPVPLKAANSKQDIDYAKFESDVRERHREEILEYLKYDCVYLHQIVEAFVERFGFRLTIAGTAMRELQKHHDQINCGPEHDAEMRPWYFGGRVECFKTGVVKGKWKVYDVNSMYPYVMREFRHPLGSGYLELTDPKIDRDGWLQKLPSYMYFAEVTGENRGALPMRGSKSADPLDFNVSRGTFLTTSHELRAAIYLGRFKVHKIERALVPRQTQTFESFVDTFMAEKVSAKLKGDKIKETFSKLILNSAYGRFGINPYEFYEYYFQHFNEDPPDSSYKPYEQNDDYVIWRRPTYGPDSMTGKEPGKNAFADVAIAASITSAARSVLMKAIAGARSIAYCDTDSVICEGLTGVEFDATALGAWKTEAEGDELAIAGKKLYSLFDQGEEVKSASKGVRLGGDDIRKVALGEQIEWQSMAPSFSIGGNTKFITRTSKKTVL